MVLMAGCSPAKLYHWGTYEASVLRSASGEYALDSAKEIATLERTLQDAERRNKPLPPGFRAHLGWLYDHAGDGARARMLFEEEMNNYPQSTELMTRLITGGAAQPEEIGS